MSNKKENFYVMITIPQFLGFSDSENKESEPENNIVNEMSDGARGQWVLLNTG